MKAIIAFCMGFLLLVSCQSDVNEEKANQIKFAENDFTLDESVQLEFEEEAISSVQLAVKRITARVVAENAIKLSEFANKRRQQRSTADYVSQSHCTSHSHSKDCIFSNSQQHCISRQVSEIDPENGENPFDTLVGNVFVNNDGLLCIKTTCDDLILLDITDEKLTLDSESTVAFFGHFEMMSPVDSRFTSIFKVSGQINCPGMKQLKNAVAVVSVF